MTKPGKFIKKFAPLAKAGLQLVCAFFSHVLVLFHSLTSLIPFHIQARVANGVARLFGKSSIKDSRIVGIKETIEKMAHVPFTCVRASMDEAGKTGSR